MPKINVYVPQWLADGLHDSDVAVSEVCQHALAAAVGRSNRMPDAAEAKDWWRHQPYEERAKDLERAAIAIRYALAPSPTVPAMIKPIGAATALAWLRRADPTLLRWEMKAQDATGAAAALEVATELGAPKAVIELLKEKVAAAQEELDAVEVSETFGPRHQVLDLVAELQARAHPQPPR